MRKTLLAILTTLFVLFAVSVTPASAAPKNYDNGDVALSKTPDKVPDGSKERPWSLVHAYWEKNFQSAVIQVEKTFSWVSEPLGTKGNWKQPDYNNPRDRLIFYGSRKLLEKQLRQHAIDIGVLQQIAQVSDPELRKQLFQLYKECSLKNYLNDRPWEWKRFRDKYSVDPRFTGKVNLSFDGSTELVAIVPPSTPGSGDNNAPPANPPVAPPASPVASPAQKLPAPKPTAEGTSSPQVAASPTHKPAPPMPTAEATPSPQASASAAPSAQASATPLTPKADPTADVSPQATRPSSHASSVPAATDSPVATPSTQITTQPSSPGPGATGSAVPNR